MVGYCVGVFLFTSFVVPGHTHTQNKTHDTDTHTHTTRTTSQTPKRTPPTNTSQRSKVARRRCVPPAWLAYTRYSFTCFCVCKNQPPLCYPRPFAVPTLLQYYCATFVLYLTSPRPSLLMQYTIQYW